MKIKVSSTKIIEDVAKLSEKIDRGKYDSIFGIPRGGVPIAFLLGNLLDLPVQDAVSERTLVVDDLVDSGRTANKWGNDLAVLYVKPHSPKPAYYVEVIDGWIEFAYEDTKSDREDVITRLLEHIGQDPTREGLLETPMRVMKFYDEFLSPPEYKFTVFDSEGYDEMIVQDNIPFFSLCEHHLVPFFGKATVAYIPNGKIVGLSKLTRTVEHYARRLQNQERITHQIANKIQEELNPIGVAVSLRARHLCMEMRGVETHDAYTTTTKLIGAFREDSDQARQEFLNVIRSRND